MIAVGIRELKDQLSAYVAKVRRGEQLVVTDRGREVALVVPISNERDAVQNLLKAGRAAWSGGKPTGLRGVKARGKPLSTTVLEGRR